jgi:hypothetical protein
VSVGAVVMDFTCSVNQDMLESNSINCAEHAANNDRKLIDARPTIIMVNFKQSKTP